MAGFISLAVIRFQTENLNIFKYRNDRLLINYQSIKYKFMRIEKRMVDGCNDTAENRHRHTTSEVFWLRVYIVVMDDLKSK